VIATSGDTNSFIKSDVKGLEFPRQMFARATVIDPGYARAYAGVADCWFVSVHVV